jgi:hypothetical protein
MADDKPKVSSGKYIPVDPSFTIEEFCKEEKISEATYYKLRDLERKLGRSLLPAEWRPPGTAIVRITAQARREWQGRAPTMNRAEDEDTARVAQARRAGKRGAASPEHRCRKKR